LQGIPWFDIIPSPPLPTILLFLFLFYRSFTFKSEQQQQKQPTVLVFIALLSALRVCVCIYVLCGMHTINANGASPVPFCRSSSRRRQRQRQEYRAATKTIKTTTRSHNPMRIACWNVNGIPTIFQLRWRWRRCLLVFNKNNNGSNGSSNNYNNSSSSSSKDSNNILHIWEEFFLARDWSSSFLLAATLWACLYPSHILSFINIRWKIFGISIGHCWYTFILYPVWYKTTTNHIKSKCFEFSLGLDDIKTERGNI